MEKPKEMVKRTFSQVKVNIEVKAQRTVLKKATQNLAISYGKTNYIRDG